ncbi:DUF1127 domain-containing protein [Pseudomonas sp. N040]|nr:DUF1127 domain-containing protein [Pseudomonas sp. N040]MBW7014891.1 DUF1127 domain-containing protein [Pseudomonas sp. N040]
MNNPSAKRPLATGIKLSPSLRNLLGKAWRQLQRWWELAEQRRKLALLDERALHDLGLSRADALQESERPFWDDPLARRQPEPAAPSLAGDNAVTRRWPS